MVLFLLASLFSCAGVSTDGDASALDPDFFNLIEFVAQEKERLANTPITKTVIVNGSSETQEIAKVDWDLELAPFAQSNIDRPGIWDSYSVDTTKGCGNRYTLAYTALDSNNFTKSINLLWSDVALPLDSLFALSIDNGFNSFIANTGQRLVWWTGGYEIMSVQDAILSDGRTLSIEGIWDAKSANTCVEQLLENGL